MKFTILKDKSAMLKELYRRYGNIEELEDVIIGQLDEFIVKEGEDKSLTFVSLHHYMNDEHIYINKNIVVLSNIDIDEYIFFKLMQNRKDHVEVMVSESVSNLYMHYFNAQMKYRIGCKKKEN